MARCTVVPLFRRRPEPWREDVSLASGERVLLARECPSGWIVATTDALWLPERNSSVRVGWEAVDSATWDRESSTLTVRQTALLGQRPRRWVVRMNDDRDLLLLIKERVRASLVDTRHIVIDDDLGVTIVARRAPRADYLSWAVSVDPGIDVDDPDVRARIDDALRMLRRDLGQ